MDVGFDLTTPGLIGTYADIPCSLWDTNDDHPKLRARVRECASYARVYRSRRNRAADGAAVRLVLRLGRLASRN